MRSEDGRMGDGKKRPRWDPAFISLSARGSPDLDAILCPRQTCRAPALVPSGARGIPALWSPGSWSMFLIVMTK
jgi:hypothetical protein